MKLVSAPQGSHRQAKAETYHFEIENRARKRTKISIIFVHNSWTWWQSDEISTNRRRAHVNITANGPMYVCWVILKAFLSCRPEGAAVPPPYLGRDDS